MTTPVAPGSGTSRVRLLTAVAVLAAAAVGAGIMTSDGRPASFCGSKPQIVMRASDTATSRVVGDTLYVVAGDTASSRPIAAADSQHFDFRIDSGATMQLVMACVPASPRYRLRLVRELPSLVLARPHAARLAYVPFPP